MADASRDGTTRQVPTSMGRLQVADRPGDEPALVLMHGFPDDSRIYNRLVSLLSPRRAVAFDFLGYGGSDRPRAGLTDPADQRMWLLGHTERQFGADPLDPGSVGITSVLPQFFGDGDQPDPMPAIRAWTAALFGDLDAQDRRITQGQLASLDIPVRLVFGALDRYLSPGLAAHLASLFGRAGLHLVDGASHWPQWDQPKAVAEVIR